MFNVNRKSVLAAACAVALLFAAAVGVDAQSNIPLGEDDIVACIQVEQETWVAPLSLRQELELHFGLPALVEPLGAVIDRTHQASPGAAVHFEGAEPSQSVSDQLDALGYVGCEYVVPVLPSAMVAVRRAI